MYKQSEYTSYGSTPKKTSNKGITIALIASRIIIFLGIRRVFFRQPVTTEPTVKDPSEMGSGQTVRRFIGEKVLLAGDLQRTSEFSSSHSHVLTTVENQTFGLKSATADLFSYSGSVEIKGEVADFYQEMPIIQVEEIIKGGAVDSGTGAAMGNEEYYYFEEDGLGFDLSISDGYDVVQGEGEIQLVDTTTAPQEVLLSISPFECIAGHALQDCSGLMEKFTSMNSDSFTSSQNITFYNLGETNTRFAFNGEGKGYSVRPSSPEHMNNFIGFMQFITEPRLKAFVESKKNECRSLEYNLNTISEVTFDEVQSGLIRADIKGKGNNDESVVCTMGIRLGTTLTVVEASIQAAAGTMVPDTTDTDAPPVIVPGENTDTPEPAEPADTVATGTIDTDTTVGVAPTQTVVARPASFEGRLDHKSARGYTVRLSDPNVSFNGIILESPVSLGMQNVMCVYRIQITSRQNADAIETNPDIEMYECKGSVTAATAQSQNLQIVGTSGDVTFLTKYVTNNLEGFQMYVE